MPGQRRFKALALNDNVPLRTAGANDTAYENVFAEQFFNVLQADDDLIEVSTSGKSPNGLKPLQAGLQHGALAIGFTGCDGGQLKNLVDHCVFVPSDHIC